ncbi:hypothetical protein SNE40_009943 [Patella caerulea]|uniref:C2H2-type domain-containing protein n=1 Tax=Patella caerulea TaxID=87958 RepID=A0AAN8JSD2_PATCE
MEACVECGKVFSKRCHVLRHLRERHNPIFYRCHTCTKEFRRKEYRRQHKCKGIAPKNDGNKRPTEADPLEAAIKDTIGELAQEPPSTSFSTATVAAARDISPNRDVYIPNRSPSSEEEINGAPYPDFNIWDYNTSPDHIVGESWTTLPTSRSDIWSNRDPNMDSRFKVPIQQDLMEALREDPFLSPQLSASDLCTSAFISGLGYQC